MTMLTNLFRHHAWANLALIDALSALPAEDLNRKTPGGFGTILETLTHYVYNEGRFIDVLNNGTTDLGEVPHEQPTLEQLRVVVAESNARVLEFAGRLQENDRVSGTIRGREFDFPAYVPLFQAYHHAVEHRTNITMVLAVYDLPVPSIDLWSYFAAGEPG
ncbi:MAG: DinB family protein [bacterium]